MAETPQKQTFNLGEFLQKNFLAIAILVGVILWYTKKPAPTAGQLISSDTTRTQIVQPIIVNPSYQPQQQGNTVYVPIPQGSQPVVPASTMAELIEQVKQLSQSRESLAKEYYAIRNYNDSIQLKDSTGNRVGVVNLHQTVSENILKSTQPSYQLSFPLTTIKNTVAAKLKNQWFMGVSVRSPIQLPKVQAIDLSILVKNKREDIISLSGGYNLQTKLPEAQLGYYKKLSFKSPISKLLPL